MLFHRVAACEVQAREEAAGKGGQSRRPARHSMDLEGAAISDILEGADDGRAKVCPRPACPHPPVAVKERHRDAPCPSSKLFLTDCPAARTPIRNNGIQVGHKVCCSCITRQIGSLDSFTRSASEPPWQRVTAVDQRVNHTARATSRSSRTAAPGTVDHRKTFCK